MSRSSALLMKCRALLTDPRLPLYAAILAVLLTLPSLSAGLIIDDYFHKVVLQGKGAALGIHRSQLDIFRFFDGDIAQMMDKGLLPWWTYPGLKGAFWRPLTSLTHWADYKLWPDSPPLMHLQSILWYGLLVIAARFLYRRMTGPVPAAGLATILYAISHTHATPVTFLANRNSLPAAICGIVALLAHHRWRKGWRPGALIGPLMVAVSLLFKEEGIATFAYLFAYALFLEDGRLWKRLSALTPYVLVIVAWRIVWVHMGYGVANVGYYVDPLLQPMQFLHALAERLPRLLYTQLGGDQYVISWIVSPAVVVAIALTVLSVILLAMWSLLRENRTARFWALGMLLSVIPVCATFDDDRLLIFPGIGAMGLLAMFILGEKTGRFRKPVVAVSGILVVIHLVLSPIALAGRCAVPHLVLGRIFAHLELPQPLDRTVEHQDIIVVNPPVNFFMTSSLLEMAGRDEPIPRHMRALTSSLLQPVGVRRTDANTIVVTPDWGYLCNINLGDTLFRTERHPLKKGDIVRLPNMTARILSLTRDGRPQTVAFRFSVPLEDPSLRWLQWKDGRSIPFTPPRVGQTVTLPGPRGGMRQLFRR